MEYIIVCVCVYYVCVCVCVQCVCVCVYVCVYTHTHTLTHTHTHTHTHTLAESMVGVSQSSALRQHMETVRDARRLEVEVSHQWRQAKNLFRHISNQEKEMNRTEKYVRNI